jgi:hypothetical protein
MFLISLFRLRNPCVAGSIPVKAALAKVRARGVKLVMDTEPSQG